MGGKNSTDSEKIGSTENQRNVKSDQMSKSLATKEKITKSESLENKNEFSEDKDFISIQENLPKNFIEELLGTSDEKKNKMTHFYFWKSVRNRHFISQKLRILYKYFDLYNPRMEEINKICDEYRIINENRKKLKLPD